VRPPEDALLAALLRKHFADRQLRLDPALAAWLLPRLPREAAAVAEAAARLDRAALARGGGRLTRTLACLAMRGMPGFGAGEDDDAVPPGEEASTPAPRLL
jgi:chromosomal replication initiation ATPase DnaA